MHFIIKKKKQIKKNKAFINRSQAYDIAAHVGLVLFNSTFEQTLEFTAAYESFRDRVDKVKKKKYK